MRKLLSVVALLGLSLSLVVATPAAAEVSAKSSTRGNDPTGDVPFCQGDLVNDIAEWTDAGLSFAVGTACPSSTNDASWYMGGTLIGWFVDLNGDNDPDYLATFEFTQSGVDAFLRAPSGAVVCDGEALHSNTTGGFRANFAASCLPGPFTFFAAMVWDESPTSPTCTCPEDDAPDASFDGPVYRGDPPPPPPLKGQGYWMLGRTGDVYAFGDAGHYGNNASPSRSVDLEPTPSGRGYWVLTENGQVGIYGDARSYEWVLASQLRPFETATAISRTPSGRGYWIFTSFGRVFAFGDAPFFGDMSATKLNGPVLDAIPTPTGQGYYMVGSDGGIFTFGDATFRGSMGDVRLNAPVQSLVPDVDGAGYWLVASDGGIFAFDAEFYGSMGSTPLNKPVTGMVGFGKGYLMVGEDGGIFTFGDAPFYGSLGENPPGQPIVSTAILNQ